MDMHNTVSFSDSVFLQQIDDEYVLLDLNTENYFGLDSVASDIWTLLHEGKSIGETYETLLEQYDVDPDALRNDLETFINTLIDYKLATLN